MPRRRLEGAQAVERGKSGRHDREIIMKLSHEKGDKVSFAATTEEAHPFAKRTME
jgi:hypothetical protein